MSRRFSLAALALAILAGGCEDRDGATPEPDPEAPPALPALPVAEAPLERDALLIAVLRAGSAAISGQADAEAQRRLDGKRFALRMRFGCPQAPAEETRRAAFAERERVVRIEIAPEIDSATPLIAQVIDTPFEAVEGFWVRRPWLLDAACPRPPRVSAPAADGAADAGVLPGPAAAGEPQPRIAVAQFFTAEDARTHRRQDRAYQATEKLAEGEGPSTDGYDLVIEGRLQRLGNGKVIACRPADAGPPACVVSVRIDQVAVERGDNGKLVAEWPSG